MATPPVGGANPYVNHSGNPLRAQAASNAASNTASRVLLPQSTALVASPGGLRARDVKAVVHHTPAGDVVEYNAHGAIRNANPPAPHGGGTYAFKKR